MPSKRRYLISAAVLTACACIAVGILAILPPRPGVTKANFDRIIDGMTLPEVEAILGNASAVKTHIHPSFRAAEWYRNNDGMRLTCVVFADKVAVNKIWVQPDENLSAKLLRLLHLPAFD